MSMLMSIQIRREEEEEEEETSSDNDNIIHKLPKFPFLGLAGPVIDQKHHSDDHDKDRGDNKDHCC
jgi:hypothetical protein